MDDTTATEVARTIVGAYADQLQAAGQMASTHVTVIAMAIAPMPPPEEDGLLVRTWEDTRGAEALVIHNTTLFTLTAAVSPEDYPQPTIESRPLRNTVVKVEYSGRTPVLREGQGYKTRWSFNLRTGDPVKIDGQVQTDPTEELDDAEKFAQRLASRCGWKVA